MGLITVQERIAQASAAGDTIDPKGFEGAAQSFEFDGLQEGDVIQFPEQYDVYKVKAGRLAGAKYVIVPLLGGGSARLFPGTFRKSRVLAHEEEGRVVMNMDGNRAARLRNQGTAVDLFNSVKTSANAQMDAFKGKGIKYTRTSDTKEVMPFRGQTGIQTTTFIQLDLCDYDGNNVQEDTSTHAW